MGPVDYIPRIRDNYARLGYKTYNWVVNADTPPWAPLSKPLSRCRLGLAASGGIYSSRRVTEDLAPRLTARFLEDGVDAVLLVPV